MEIIKKIHFYLGLTVITHFAITGILLRINYFSITPQDTLVRMMLRANHIYILFSGLVNLLISYSLHESKIQKLHIAASFILLISTIGINLSFYIDPIHHLDIANGVMHRKLTGYSVQAFLIGTVLYLVGLQAVKMKKEKSDRIL
jgi:hypothetical protein